MKKTAGKEKNKNVSKRKKVTVQELKKNEKEYTYLFAGVFLALFIYCGYQLFIVPEDKIVEQIEFATTSVADSVEGQTLPNVSLSSDVVFLGEDKKLSLEDGLLTRPYSVEIQNHNGEKIHYQLRLVRDHFLESKCGCKNTYDSYVWVSIQGVSKRLSDFPNGIIYEDDLEEGENAELSIRFWFDESLPLEEEYTHYHGIFEVNY